MGNPQLLIHFNGTNGQNTYTAETGQTVTFSAGSPQLSTTDPKLGSASLLLDGNSDYVTIPSSADWTLGTGDFTIAMWVKFANRAVANPFIVLGESVTDRIFLSWNSDNILYLVVTRSNSYVTYCTMSWVTPTVGQWYHVAISRSSGSLKVFIDGVSKTITYSTGNGAENWDTINGVLCIGSLVPGGLSYWFNGNIDEVYWNKGTCLYPTDFTPPTGEYSLTAIKKIAGVAYSSVKKVAGVAIASVKKFAGVA